MEGGGGGGQYSKKSLLCPCDSENPCNQDTMGCSQQSYVTSSSCTKVRIGSAVSVQYFGLHLREQIIEGGCCSS